MQRSLRCGTAFLAALALAACDGGDAVPTQPRLIPTAASHDAIANSCAAAPSGLVGWYSGDNGGLDQAGTHNAILSANVGQAPGMVGQAFAFNGSAGSRITVPASSAIGLGNAPRTYTMWVYVNAGSWAQDRHTIFNAGLPGNTFALDMDLYPNMQFYTWGNDRLFSPGISATTRSGWAHLAFTYDGSSVAIYLNGNPAGSYAANLNTPNAPLYIGNAWSSVDFPFTGLVDEFMIFNRALSGSEIQQSYAAGAAGTCSLSPSVSLPSNLSVTEGTAVAVAATTTDANPGAHTYAWDIDGDGVVDSTNTTGALSLTYADAGSYSVHVTVTNAQGKSASASTTIGVTDAAPVITSINTATSFPVGGTFTLAGVFSDAGTQDGPWSASVDWGDHTTSTVSLATQGAISATHEYDAYGSYTVHVTVTNQDGLTSAERTVAVNTLDVTAPVITFAGNAGTYTVDQQVAISCSATDSESGVASSTCTTWKGPAYTFTVGGAGNTLSATAVDYAGNPASASTSFTVGVSNASLCALVQRFVSNAGVAKSFCAKLAPGSYGAFRNEVSAQTGKKISSADAAVLLQLVDVLARQ